VSAAAEPAAAGANEAEPARAAAETGGGASHRKLVAIGLALLIVVLAGAIVGLAVGGGGSPTPAELAQRRAHLAYVGRGLGSVETQVRRELSTAEAAWPSIAEGLPAKPSRAATVDVAAALSAAEAVPSPQFVALIDELAGPAVGIAKLFMSSQQLVRTGWQHVYAALSAAEGSADASFSRASSALYIESIYQGMFDLSVLGERAQTSYVALGGAKLFGGALTEAQMRSLLRTYSPSERLEPHAVLAPSSP
jgi:hypothetical protein